MCYVDAVEYLLCIHEQLVNVIHISSGEKWCVEERGEGWDCQKCRITRTSTGKMKGGEKLERLYLHLWNSLFVSNSPVS